MARYHVVSKDKKWIVLGGKTDKKIYITKKEAVVVARQFAKAEDAPLIVHNRDGKIEVVITNRRDSKTGKILTANVKHRLNNDKVKRTIASIISDRKGIR
jgi:hypothetical protein